MAIDDDGVPSEGAPAPRELVHVVLPHRRPALAEPVDVGDAAQVVELVDCGDVGRFPHRSFGRLAVAKQHVGAVVRLDAAGVQRDANRRADALAERAGRHVDERQPRRRMAFEVGIDPSQLQQLAAIERARLRPTRRTESARHGPSTARNDRCRDGADRCGSNRISAKNSAATRSAAEQQLVGCPLPASDVDLIESIRSRVAMFFRAGIRVARSRDIRTREIADCRCRLQIADAIQIADRIAAHRTLSHSASARPKARRRPHARHRVPARRACARHPRVVCVDGHDSRLPVVLVTMERGEPAQTRAPARSSSANDTGRSPSAFHGSARRPTASTRRRASSTAAGRSARTPSAAPTPSARDRRDRRERDRLRDPMRHALARPIGAPPRPARVRRSAPSQRVGRGGSTAPCEPSA